MHEASDEGNGDDTAPDEVPSDTEDQPREGGQADATADEAPSDTDDQSA